jgi:hypothetical protein
MDDLDPVIVAQLAGLTVRYADLVRFYFKSGEMRLWQGHGILVDGNGEQWQGIGRLGRIGAITAGPGGAIQELTLQLFGDERMNRYFSEDAEDSAGQEAVRYLQFFDVRQFDGAGNWVEWHPIGAPLEIFRGEMGPLQSDRPAITDPAQGTGTRVISVKLLNAMINRKKPPNGYWSNKDQLARTNGTDNIFQKTSEMANASVRWPYGLT